MPQANPRSCPRCGADNPVGNRFCGTCGNRLDAPPAEERRWATVVFVDISGFTSLAEQMDPEDVGNLARRCVALFSEQINRFGGAVLREFGDEVLAVFGAPVAHEDDPERAVRAALAIRDADLPSAQGVPLRVHVGVNTGEIVSATVEIGDHSDRSIHGDAVNTAARLRSGAPPGTVWVGEETWRATHRVVRYRELAPMSAKGKEHPLPVWEAVDVGAVPVARKLGSAPLVGRDPELGLLRSLWAKARNQLRPHLVTIVGEPGIGKSRLAAEFEQAIAGDEPIVVHGRCPPYGEVFGYWALAMALREAAGIPETADPEQGRALLDAFVRDHVGDDEIVIEHMALLGGFSDTSADGPSLQASLRRFVEAVCRNQPAMWVIDDIHWADDALIELLEFLASSVRDAPLMLVTTARPLLLRERPSWGRGVRAFTMLSLEPLGAADAQELVAALAAQHGLGAEIAERFATGAGGNPLFAEELVAMLVERGAAAKVPSAIKALISARIDALAPDVKATLQRAAVFGKAFWEGGLAALDIPGPLAEHLEQLQDRDLVRAEPQSRFPGHRQFAFKHDFIHDVAYDMLLRADRRALHRGILDWAERAAGDRRGEYLDLLVHHATRADEHERAIEHLIDAAARARRTAQRRREAALLGQAFDLAEQRGDSQTATDILIRRAEALRAGAVWPEALAALDAALARLPEDRLETRAELLLSRALVAQWSGPATVRGVSEQALAAAERAGREDLAAGALAQLALADAIEGQPNAGLKRFDAALERARAHDVSLDGSAFEPFVRGTVMLYWVARNQEAVQRTREVLDRARALGDTLSILQALSHLGLSLSALGRYAESIEVFDEARSFGREYELWGPLARGTAMAAGLHIDLDDLPTHLEIAEEARDLARGRLEPTMAYTGVDRMLNHIRRGDVGAAEASLPSVIEDVDGATAWHRWLLRARLSVARAELALARDDGEGAVTFADEALARARPTGRRKYEALANVARGRGLHLLGRVPEALADLDAAIALAEEIGDPALTLRAVSTRLGVEGTDALAAKHRALVDGIAAELPDGLRERFLASR